MSNYYMVGFLLCCSWTRRSQWRWREDSSIH